MRLIAVRNLLFQDPRDPRTVIDSVAVIPADDFDANVLQADQIDRRLEFNQKCGLKYHFNIGATEDDSTDSFCRDTMISLTSAFNEGALDCDCNTEGSEGSECEPIGGQCNCLPNVIGRQCTRCKPDFFGYPNCKQCTCPATAR